MNWRFYLLILLVCTTSCEILRNLSRNSSSSLQEFRLVQRWAPIHYQDVDQTGGDALGGKSDYLTAIDFDGDWNTRNNWEALENDANEPSAHVYYSVAKTETHWFIIYAFYHPRDWVDFIDLGLDTHENDLEGLLAIVKRPQSESDPEFGSLQAIITVFHNDFYSFTPSGSPFSSHLEDIDGRIEMRDFGGNLHPVTAQEAKGHGLKAYPYVRINGGDGIIYYPGLTAEVPSSPDDRNVFYRLVDIFSPNGLWSRRNNSETFQTYGTFNGDNGKGSANAPWQWNDSNDECFIVAGDLAVDPVKVVKSYFSNLGNFSEVYESNPYEPNPNSPSPTGPSLVLHEGNNVSQDYVCCVNAGRNRSIDFTNYKCDNDEARSLTLFDIPPGKVIRLFDHPQGRREDDWVEIIAKLLISRKNINSFEQSFEDDEVRVIYHSNNGLDGKVSRLEIDDNPSGPQIDLYEGNQASQNLLCSVSANQNRSINFTNHGECDNDETRSIKMYDMPTGKVLKFYDHPAGNKEDDWTEIIVKRPFSEKIVGSLEQSFEDNEVRVIYHRNNGLDGKVSRLEISNNPTGAQIDLYEGNQATQNLVCSISASQNRSINFTSHGQCDNDEARSAVLYDMLPGKVIRLFDNPSGLREDDWVEILVKRSILSKTISSFEESFEDNDLRVIYHQNNGLDGKVSRLQIDNNPTGAQVDFFEGNNTSQNLLCSISLGNSRTINFKNHSQCDNDEARSLILYDIPAGKRLQLYDNPNGRTNDDWVEIISLRHITSKRINTFEQSFQDSDVNVIYHRDNGLDGKVSRLVYRNN